MNSFRDACRTYGFDHDDEARLRALWPPLAPHAATIASRLAPILAGEHVADAWVSLTLEGPWESAYAAGLQLARGCVERGVPWLHVCSAFAAMRAHCLALLAEHAPATSLLAVRSLNRIVDLQLAAWLKCYQATASAGRHAALQTLSAGLAHELRNPLNSARLQLEVLDRRLRKAGGAEDLFEPVARVHHEIDRLSELASDFLAFAQPHALALADTDVTAVLRRAIDAERPLAGDRGVAVRLEAPAIHARVDAGKLQQIVQHLVRNAIEASPRGGSVVVTAGDGDHLTIAITDSGGGIPDPILRRIYEPFFSTKEGGTGLGLSIVQSLVALHGGAVAVSTAGHGTRIDVTLPR